MRTTLDLDDALMRKLKARAATEGETMTRIIEEAIRGYLTERRSGRKAFTLKLLTKRGTRIPAPDFDDRDSIYQAMERP